MHVSKIPRIAVAFSLFFIVSGSVKALEEFAVWKAENIESSDSQMSWPDSKRENILVLAKAEGVSVGEAPNMGDDSKSAVFSGEQQAAFVSTTRVTEFTGSMEIKLLFNPGLEPAGTIIRFNRQWQLGLKKIGQKNYVELMVWHDSGGMTFVPVEVELDKWQEIIASVTDNTAKISCGGKQNSKNLTEPIRHEPAGASIYVGLPVAATSAANKELTIPLRASIADIRLAL